MLNRSNGLIYWLTQRITSVIMLGCVILFITFFIHSMHEIHHVNNYFAWKEFCSSVVNKLILQIFIIAVVKHAYIGVHDILIDYIKINVLRNILIFLSSLWLLFSFLFSIVVIW